MNLSLSNLGFKQRIILTVAILVAVALSITNWLSYRHFKEDKVATIEQKSRLIVDSAKREIELSMNLAADALESTKGFYAGEHSDSDYVEVARLITKAADYASFTAGYTDGRAYGDSGGNDGVFEVSDYDPRTRGWYKEAMAKNRTILTDFYTDATTGSLMVSVATPISSNKEGVVVGDISLKSLNETIGHVDFPGAVTLILSEDFIQLASTDPTEELGVAFGLPDLEREMATQGTGAADYQWNGADKRAYFTEIPLVDGNKWYLYVGVNKSIVYADVEKAFEEAVTTSVIMLLIALAIVIFVLNQLYRPITALKETVQDLSAGTGDLTRRLEVNSKDDLGQIAESVNIFIGNLQQMMLEVQQATSHISASVEDLRQQSEQNTGVLQSHVDETDQVVTAINEMSITAENVSANAAETSSHIHQTNDQAQESKIIVSNAVSSVSALIGDVESMAESISEMNRNSIDIAGVLKVIGDIAEQTNLLALNAAIEAARAGEQGRGFAVVADEVRALAARTQQSTSEIEQMLNRLTSGADELVTNMNVIKESCNETASNTEQVNLDLDKMASSINEVNNLAVEIATAAEEQSSVSEEISKNMASIRHMADTLAESGRHNLESSQTLASANTQLAAIVSKFKLS
ncbi:Methyl-accepting chemotaxis protein [Photobacterium marinum]|uniref:Methyl-accepting chemotaxis protein n=1 Tax=Photobacterium marinum TaxID=1056511 RepID=L8J9F0_9GAMM|nr:methyl-accepting chemotaxis protein [Photobacterium marinum]ELR65510.1 Methyl-accepting chemotaxis protein [Photobacterium marinum]